MLSYENLKKVFNNYQNSIKMYENFQTKYLTKMKEN